MYTKASPVENTSSLSKCFMKTFKYYKAKQPKPTFDKVIKITGVIDEDSEVVKVSKKPSHDYRSALLGLQDLDKWLLFSFKKHPGLLMIKNPFTTMGQRYWIRKCLQEYPKKPNKKNIDSELDINDWWSTCFHKGTCDRELQKKLRWTTLGYHHNWDTKEYTDENKSDFPQDLAELSDIVVAYLGFDSFKAEAAIVNYYHMDSTLSAHTDHSEINLEAPLLSFSFGQSAIFLIGGKDKCVEPSAIMVESGDVLVMSKEARLCYHAVPKILPTTNQPWNNTNDVQLTNNLTDKYKFISNANKLVADMNRNIDDWEWNRFNDYISVSRINMNVRQVLHANQLSLKDMPCSYS